MSAEAAAVPLAAGRATGAAVPGWQGAGSAAGSAGGVRGFALGLVRRAAPRGEGRSGAAGLPLPSAVGSCFAVVYASSGSLLAETYRQVYRETAAEGPGRKDPFVAPKRGRSKSTQDGVVQRQQFKKKKKI